MIPENEAETMSQEDLEFLGAIREIPDKIHLPSDFHSQVMQTIHRRSPIALEAAEQRQNRLPKVRKWFEWHRVTRYAQAAVLVLVVTGVLCYLHAANQSAFREMEASITETQNRISVVSEQLQELERKNQERYESLATVIREMQASFTIEKEKVAASTSDRFLEGLALGVSVFLAVPNYGTAQDFTQAAHWYQNAAANGDLSAMVKLSLMYLAGLGFNQNEEEARKWYDKANIQDKKETERYLATYLPAAFPSSEPALKETSPSNYMEKLLYERKRGGKK